MIFFPDLPLGMLLFVNPTVRPSGSTTSTWENGRFYWKRKT